LITPNANFRADPHRAIYVSGGIDHNLVTALTPEILKLQSTSRSPITIYIDSAGGAVASMENLLRLLRLSDQDSADPCRIITVATNRAASAAADLLSSGDYAIAHRHSAILYHGVRRQANAPLTVELSSLLGRVLRLSNDRYAMELARKIEDRFSFRFMLSRPEFDDLRTEMGKPQMSDLECFVEFINRRLSSDAVELWARARARHLRYRNLFDTIGTQTDEKNGVSRATLEANRIKAIVDFEVRANAGKTDWSFTDGGLESVADDFFLLNEYVSTAEHERLQQVCSVRQIDVAGGRGRRN
jgi:hypothetical protein